MDGVGFDEDEVDEANKLWQMRSLSRANLILGSVEDAQGNVLIEPGDEVTPEQRKLMGFGVVLDSNDPDYVGDNIGTDSFGDKYGVNNTRALKDSVDTVNMGYGITDQEGMAKRAQANHNQTIIYDALHDPTEENGLDPTRATQLTGENADVMILEYFYLGDLIDVLIHHIRENPDFKHSHIKGEDQRQLIFAPIKYEHPLLAGLGEEIATNFFINLADIPISAKYFSSWFRKNYVLKLQDSIRFDQFFKLLIDGLVFKALGEECYYGSQNAQSNLGLKTIITGKKIDEITKTINQSQGNNPISLHQFHPSWVKKAFDGTWQEEFLEIEPHQQWHEYYLIYANSYVPSFLSGRPERDLSKGIHHIYVGANKGLMKNITFEKIDQPSVQTYKMAAAGSKDVKEIYKMKMSMIGNNFFEPGQLVYINPALAGLGTINRSRQLELQRDLGLGGYFRINTVDGVVESGNFETIVGGYWETHGAPYGISESDVTEFSSGVGPQPHTSTIFADPNKIRELREVETEFPINSGQVPSPYFFAGDPE